MRLRLPTAVEIEITLNSQMRNRQHNDLRGLPAKPTPALPQGELANGLKPL